MRRGGCFNFSRPPSDAGVLLREEFSRLLAQLVDALESAAEYRRCGIRSMFLRGRVSRGRLVVNLLDAALDTWKTAAPNQ